ncbi:MAG: 30S ribosome-binding factor RbfA [Candidatus Wallbacteria bacterium]|nr:30S ribosome-binding factor RbfA [Candidatus Wallbacteria bacterium]
MTITRKMERVQRELQRRIASLVLSELKDPRLAYPFAITDAEISGDLRLLKVFVSIDAPPAEQEVVLGVLRKASGRLRHLMGDGLELRVVPEIRFLLDDTPENAQRIDRILDGLHQD